VTASAKAADLRRKLFDLLAEFKDFHQAIRGRAESALSAKGMADIAACAVAKAYESVSETDLFYDAHRDEPEYTFAIKTKDDEHEEEFAGILARIRTAAGLSIPDLARASGLSDDVLRQYETGKRRPTWDSVQQIAKSLGVPTDVFRDQQ